MSIVRIALASVACVGAIVLLGPAPAAAAEAQASEKYFGCPNGYTFQANASAARCYYAGVTLNQNIVCPVAYVKAIDQFNGGKDGCQSKMNVVANYSCPSGYSPKVQPGPDVCTKAAVPSIVAPTVEKKM